MNDRVYISDEAMRIALENALDALKPLQYDNRYRLHLGDSFVQKLIAWERDIRARKEDRMTMVVIGDFKRGKSSFINALLGEDVVTTDVNTETVTMNRIRYGGHSNAAVLSNNRQMALEDGELRRESLQAVLEKIGEPVKRLELKRPCELLKKLTIIDTPGMDDALMNFDDLVKESLLQADVVLYVYNVNYPLSRSEQLFLKSAVLPHKYTSLILVGNYADTLEDIETYERQRQGLKKRIEGLLPDAEVITLSALDELCRQKNLPRPCKALEDVLAEQFEKVRRLLDEVIENKGDTVLVDRMQHLSAAMVEDLEIELESVSQGVRMTSAEADEAIRRVEAERDACVANQTDVLGRVDDAVNAMKAEAKAWMSEFVGRIAAECGGLREQSADVLFKYYECYCVDMLQQAVDACLDYHQEQLYGILDEISGDLSERLAVNSARRKDYSFRISVDNRIWTKGDTAGLVISQIGLSGVLGMASNMVTSALAGMRRSDEKEKAVPQIVAQIAEQMNGLAISVNEVVDQLYAELLDKAKRLIADYYQETLDNSERLARQTLATAEKEKEQKQQIQATVDEARAALAAFRMVFQEEEEEEE